MNKNIIDKFIEIGKRGSFTPEESLELLVIGLLVPYEVSRLKGSVSFFENLIKGCHLVNGSFGGSTNQTYNLIKKLEEQDKNKAIELYNWVASNGGNYSIDENITYDERIKKEQIASERRSEILLNDQKVHLEAVARKKIKQDLHLKKSLERKNPYPEFEKRFQKMSDDQLITTLKEEMSKQGFVRARGYFISYLREEIKKRGLK